MWLKILVVSAHRKSAQRNKTLSAILPFCIVDVLLNFANNLSKATSLFIVARNESIHRWNQINTFLLNKSAF